MRRVKCYHNPRATIGVGPSQLRSGRTELVVQPLHFNKKNSVRRVQQGRVLDR